MRFRAIPLLFDFVQNAKIRPRRELGPGAMGLGGDSDDSDDSGGFGTKQLGMQPVVELKPCVEKVA